MSVFMFLTRSKTYYNKTTGQFPSCGNIYLKMLSRKEKICMIFVVFLYYLDQPPNRTKESIFWNNKKHLLGCHFYKFRTNALARTTPRRSEVNGD